MIKENIARVLSEISSGNDLGEKIILVGATKTVDAATINYAIENGLTVVAENRVQEFREKNQLVKNADQQFIGHLQTNKVKYLVGKVSLIQSIDSFHLAKAVSDECVKKNLYQNVLVEVNVGGELSKSGFTTQTAIDGVKQISTLPRVCVKGLMAMLPHVRDERLLADLCKRMRGLYDVLKNDGFPFEYLSVGMSADYKIAIRNGSNMIRIGSGIFGKRNYEVK